MIRFRGPRRFLALAVVPVCIACRAPTDGTPPSVVVVTDSVASLPLKLAPRPTAPEITESDLMTRLYVFADDSMQGRLTGTAGYLRGTAYVAAELRRLGLRPAGDDGTYFQRLAMGQGTSDSSPQVHNVVAVLPGADPALAGQYVALGAHADHLGTSTRPVDHDSLRAFSEQLWRLSGASNSPTPITASQRASVLVNVDSLRRLRPPRPDSIANGADDDGSGSMALLEIAEVLASGPRRPARSVLFVWHAAEELGLWGSAYFVQNPTVPLDSIVAQINVDMIGRGSAADLTDGGPDYLSVVGARRLSTQLGDIVEQVNDSGGHALRLDYGMDAEGHPQRIYCRSDHYNYARWGIPVAFFFTGLHADYHQVTDEPQYIDYPHYARITRYLNDLVLALADQPAQPVVDRTGPDGCGG
ncbi:MAG: M28 family peptidase [Gemmatimonadaceae bacterium]